ncbi:MAG: flagellar hook-associated protein FlgL [Deferribacteres bacterium]|nr:flagellar hook-associated protein FlgL [candidate division KSB1 bacterium]MCB9501964.1 flagellar hook-associated protein FlgL [Deferribacteres bacterium]
MRVTNNQYYIQMLRNIQRPAQDMLDIQNQLSSGKRINSYSDDPGGSAIVEKYKSTRSESEQFIRNISDGVVWMNQTESALSSLEDNLIQAKALAVQGANASNSRSERQDIGNEVNQILESILSLANSNFRGKYLFAGVYTNARPYIETRDNDGSINGFGVANDLSGTIDRAINEGVNVQINVPGDDVFNLTDGPLASIMALRDALLSNDVEGIQNSIDAVDTALEGSLTARTELGARMARMETIQFFQESQGISYTSLISEIEDADYAELSVRLATSEAGYRAAISTSARIVQTSLVDLLT